MMFKMLAFVDFVFVLLNFAWTWYNAQELLAAEADLTRVILVALSAFSAGFCAMGGFTLVLKELRK